MKNYPECDKLMEVSNTHQTLNDFVEWLYDNGMYIASYPKDTVNVNRDVVVYDFMGVDTKKLEKERRHILAQAAKY